MKTIKLIIVIVCAFWFFTSCTMEDIKIEPENSEVTATGDKGDDVGDPNDRSQNFIVKDSIITKVSATGDKGDDHGNPDD